MGLRKTRLYKGKYQFKIYLTYNIHNIYLQTAKALVTLPNWNERVKLCAELVQNAMPQKPSIELVRKYKNYCKT